MNEKNIRKSLETIARRDVPERINLWPRLAASLEKKGTPAVNPKWKLAWTIILVLVGLFAVTWVVSAFYHFFNDVGLQSVSNAGLVSTVNATALPTRVPTSTPPEPVTVIGSSQTLEGVSLTLEWIYLMDGQQAFGFSAAGLDGGKSLGIPEMTFGPLVPQQYRGAGLAVKEDRTPVSGVYIVNQIVRDENTYGKTDTLTEVGIRIPLLDGKSEVLNTFHFEVKNELVHAGPFVGGNTYLTSANGLEMSLDWIILGSRNLQARLCFTPPDGKDWKLGSPTIQLGSDPSQVASAAPLTAYQSISTTTENGIRCQTMAFLASTEDARAFLLTAGEISNSTGETIKGDWTFNWDQLPGQLQFPGIAPLEPAPLGSENIGNDVSVNLEKAYADIFRMVFVVSIKSPQQGVLVSNAALKDANGVDLNTGLGISSPPDDPTRFIIEFYPTTEFTPGKFNGQLTVEIGSQFGSSPAAQAHFAVDPVIFLATVFDPMKTAAANGVEILLQRVKVAPSYTQVYLCYKTPSAGDWGVGSGAQLQVGSDTASLGAYSLIFDSLSGYGQKIPEPGWASPLQTGRCVKVGFPVGHHGKPETMTLTIPQLEQSAAEVIPDDKSKAARLKLLAQGIDVDWTVSVGNGGGGGGLVIRQKPAGMTDEQVMQLFYEALGYYYPGPWTFTFEISP